MNGRMQTKAWVLTGITALTLISSITPLSYAAESANSPDVITKEQKNTKPDQKAEEKNWSPWNWFSKEEEKSGNKVPIQRKDGKEDQDELAGPLRDFHRDINRLFDQTFRDFGFSAFDMDRPFQHTSGGMFRPVTDLAANDKEYTITVEVPGAEKDDIKIEVANNVMTISGEKKQEKKEEDKDYYRQERFYGSFQRVLSLPEDADQEGIKASFQQGVLTVTMPRKDMPKPVVKEVKIQ
ncbi:MAG: Hsp20/alpha crystallin family protein [Candidatus Electrothrix sp. GW3-4]|uniref:Hsp20/alpha crystallin family protein n=1 Tax=Candidatus Electrothrix sp. GW3-4 TaxID=3126740 RepID=UPI0030D07B08